MKPKVRVKAGDVTGVSARPANQAAADDLYATYSKDPQGLRNWTPGLRSADADWLPRRDMSAGNPVALEMEFGEQADARITFSMPAVRFDRAPFAPISGPGRLESEFGFRAEQTAGAPMGSFDALEETQIAARVVAVEGRIVVLDEQVTMEAGESYAIRFRSGISEADTIGVSTVRSVGTIAGATNSLSLEGAGALPIAGDLVHFGKAVSESKALIIKGIESGENFTSFVTMATGPYNSTYMKELLDRLKVVDARFAGYSKNGALVAYAKQMENDESLDLQQEFRDM